MDAVISKHRPPGSVISETTLELQAPFTGNGSPPTTLRLASFQVHVFRDEILLEAPVSPRIDRSSLIFIFSSSCLYSFLTSKCTSRLDVALDLIIRALLAIHQKLPFYRS